MMVVGMMAVLVLGTSCSSHYVMTGISRSRILVDKTYDAAPDADATAFLAPYKHKVDSLMSPVVGTSAAYMAAHRPESELSNLLTDIRSSTSTPISAYIIWAASVQRCLRAI